MRRRDFVALLVATAACHCQPCAAKCKNRTHGPVHPAARGRGQYPERTMKAFPEAAYREIITSLG